MICLNYSVCITISNGMFINILNFLYIPVYIFNILCYLNGEISHKFLSACDIFSRKTCRASVQCPGEEVFCMGPSIRNSSRLVVIKRKTSTKDVLYLGSPGLLYTTVYVSNYIPKYALVPGSLPPFIETFCEYLVKFSGALAVMNIIPCFYLDGYWISGALIDLIFGFRLDIVHRRVLHMIVTTFGTGLLILNVIFCLKTLL